MSQLTEAYNRDPVTVRRTQWQQLFAPLMGLNATQGRSRLKMASVSHEGQPLFLRVGDNDEPVSQMRYLADGFDRTWACRKLGLEDHGPHKLAEAPKPKLGLRTALARIKR